MKALIFLFLLIPSLSYSHLEGEEAHYNPFPYKSYLTSSFGENRGTRYHAGIDFGTEMQEGWPILAPENGTVIQLRMSPFAYGKNLLFVGASGHQWLFAHLSGFSVGLDSLMTSLQLQSQKNDVRWESTGQTFARFKKGDTLAYSGSTGIGNPHLHLELRDSTGVQVLNPCANQVECPDTLGPQVLAAAVWDATKGGKTNIQFTSGEALSKGCLAVDPKFREPALALKLVDYGREPRENPMSLYRIALRQDTNLLYQKEMLQLTYGKMAKIREELLWSEEADTAGDWHFMGLGSEENANVLFNKKAMSNALVSKKKTIKVEILDFALHPTLLHLVPQANCKDSMNDRIQQSKLQDSILFTALARPWLDIRSICQQDSLFHIQLWSDKNKPIKDNPCQWMGDHSHTVPEWLTKWPSLRNIRVVNQQDSLLREITIAPLARSRKMGTKMDIKNLQIHIQHAPLSYANALAFTESRDSLGIPMWEMHPKGLHLLSNLGFCLTNEDPNQKLYWLGETSHLWFYFSNQKQNGNLICANMDELRDIRLQVDTIPPQWHAPRDTFAMIVGVSSPVLRFHLEEQGSGIANGNSIKVFVDNRWIPVEYDSEPSDVVIPKKWLLNAKQLRLEAMDEIGNLGKTELDLGGRP